LLRDRGDSVCLREGQNSIFEGNVEELSKTNLAQKGLKTRLSYHEDPVSGLQMELVEPDEDEFRSFLLTFRQFISEEEPVFLNHMYNICSKHLTSDELKDLVAGSRKIWANAQKVSGIPLIIGGTEMPALKVWKIWIDGRYFHNDLRYQQILDQASPEVLKLLRFNFLNFVGKTSECIAWLFGFIVQTLNENMFVFE